MSRSSDRGLRTALAIACASLAAASFALHAATAAAPKPRFGFGKPASAQEIAAWDIDVRPDGKGLPPGRGSVAKGQEIYDEKCASCHGTFGESNDYMALTGGAGSLGSDQPMRTTISKLNHATTLWDYINRAMPFAAPKTLAVDEVYAVTAYVLHLGDLLPADATLDREALLALRMPNRDGFTAAHGMGSVRGRPDTANVACMSNCASAVRISSDYPDHARDSHGNLAEQMRSIGPVDGVKTASAAAGATTVAKGPEGGELAKSNGCTACHATASKLVGPSFRDIAGRYAKAPDAEATLAGRIRAGGTGVWGQVPMPAQPQVKDAELKSIVQWILAGAR